MPGCLLQYRHNIQHAVLNRRPIFGLSGYVIRDPDGCSCGYPPIEQVTWCWLLGAVMCFTLSAYLLHSIHVWKPTPSFCVGTSIAEIVSAFPTCGGLYTASAQLCPRQHRPIVGWVVGWMNILGQAAGVSSAEFGLASMILAAVSTAKVGSRYLSNRSKHMSKSRIPLFFTQQGSEFILSTGKVVGLFASLMIIHGLLVSGILTVASLNAHRYSKNCLLLNISPG